MPDIRIVNNAAFPTTAVTLDWLLLPSGALDTSYSLATAVLIALCTDRLAAVDDVLPNPNSSNRRGWWGDLEAATIWNGWPIGSRLWLLSRSKIVDSAAAGGSTLSAVETYLNECVAPFVNAKIITSFTLDVERNSKDRNRIDASIVLYRGPLPSISLQFQLVWNEMLQPSIQNAVFSVMN